MAQNNDPKPSLWHIVGIRPLWLIVAVVIVLAIVIGSRWGSSKYDTKQQAHILEQAKAFEAKGDNRSAILSLRRVLQLDPNNVEATRMLAKQADRSNSPSALTWMKRLADLEPNNLENLSMWARCALRQNELIAADQVLARFPAAKKDSLEFHRLAGALAVQARLYQAAEFHFVKAAKLNPKSEEEQLNLATIRLLSARLEIVTESRTTLERLTKNPDFAYQAAQALLADSLRTTNLAAQLTASQKVIQLPDSRFGDRLFYLELLRRAKDVRFTTELAAVKQKAHNDMAAASELVVWMNARDQAEDAQKWAKTLSPETQAAPMMALAMAETLVKLKQWDELYNTTLKAKWQELEFLRFAFLARAQRELNLWGSSRSSWRQALTEVGVDPQSRSLLAKIAQGWGWNSEAEDIWWALARSETGRIPALKALHKIYRDTGDSRRLLKATELITEQLPDDPVIRNNYAMLSLLLGQNLPKARELARTNYEKHPQDPAAVSTYAFALREEGKLTEAVALMDKLSPDIKKIPGIAAYWGILLAEAGRGKEARPFLTLGEKADGLLPEERELIKAAQAKAAK
jgi:Flp pilus assembly protein TadD